MLPENPVMICSPSWRCVVRGGDLGQPFQFKTSAINEKPGFNRAFSAFSACSTSKRFVTLLSILTYARSSSAAKHFTHALTNRCKTLFQRIVDLNVVRNFYPQADVARLFHGLPATSSQTVASSAPARTVWGIKQAVDPAPPRGTAKPRR